MNAFVLIFPILAILIVGPLIAPPTPSAPRLVIASQPSQASAAAWRERQREEMYRRAMREESVSAVRE